MGFNDRHTSLEGTTTVAICKGCEVLWNQRQLLLCMFYRIVLNNFFSELIVQFCVSSCRKGLDFT